MKGIIMKISEKTIGILQNFSQINSGFVFTAGNEVRTISEKKNVLASAKIEEDIPSKACIYDLKRFLSTLSLHEDPEVEFSEKCFTIKGNKKTKQKYMYASESMVISPPEKNITLPTVDMKFTLSWADIKSIIQASNVLQFQDTVFTVKDGKLVVQATDYSTTDDSKDIFEMEIDQFDTANEGAVMILEPDNFGKLYPQEHYEVTFSSKGICSFKSDLIEYWFTVSTKGR